MTRHMFLLQLGEGIGEWQKQETVRELFQLPTNPINVYEGLVCTRLCRDTGNKMGRRMREPCFHGAYGKKKGNQKINHHNGFIITQVCFLMEKNRIL